MLNNPYLKLLRIPNIFTIPSNIILGYLIAISLINVTNNEVVEDGVITLLILITSSVFLYLGGLVSNDYFDEKIDSVERPNRPIPSGKVPKNNALAILVCFFLLGLILSLLVSIISFAVATLLIVCILSYNYKIKNGFFRSFLMGFIRALNITYGFSIILIGYGYFQTTISNNIFLGISTSEYSAAISILVLVSLSMFFHVFFLTGISKKEVAGHENYEKKDLVKNIKKNCYLYLIYVAIFGIFGLLILPNKIDFTLFLVSFAITVSLVIFTAIKKANQTKIEDSILYLVKNMILAIILLDSVFISGVSGYLPAILTCLLIIPSFVLGKRVSMT